MGKAIRGLLSMDHGTRLDNGCLDTVILGNMSENGYDVDALGL